VSFEWLFTRIPRIESFWSFLSCIHSIGIKFRLSNRRSMSYENFQTSANCKKSNGKIAGRIQSDECSNKWSFVRCDCAHSQFRIVLSFKTVGRVPQFLDNASLIRLSVSCGFKMSLNIRFCASIWKKFKWRPNFVVFCDSLQNRMIRCSPKMQKLLGIELDSGGDYDRDYLLFLLIEVISNGLIL